MSDTSDRVKQPDPRQIAGALHKARRIIGAQMSAVQRVNAESSVREANKRALDEAYRLIGIVMERIYPKEGR